MPVSEPSTPTPSSESPACRYGLRRLHKNLELQKQSEGSPSQPTSADRQASDDLPQRPPVIVTQSEPDLRLDAVNYPLLPQSPVKSRKRAEKKRSVSQPITHLRAPDQTPDQDATSTRQKKRRRSSENLAQDSIALSPPQTTEALLVQSTSVQPAVQRAKSPQATETPISKDNPINSEVLTTRSPDEESNQKNDKRNDRSFYLEKLKTADRIHWSLLAKVQEDITFGDLKVPYGCIYVLFDPEGYYKIGCTKEKNPSNRMDWHRNKCEEKLEVIHCTQLPFEYSYRAEQLIHRDLAKYWELKTCNGDHERHSEYFKLNRDQEQLVVSTVKRWEAFMTNERPYDSRGKLKSIWKYLLEKRCLLEDEKNLTHEARCEHWISKISTPTRAEYIAFYRYVLDADERWAFAYLCLTLYPWQISTMAYAIVTLAICQNFLAFTALSVTIVCAFRSVVLDGLTHKVPGRKVTRK